MPRLTIFALAFAALLTSAAKATCPVPGETLIVVVTFYFGESIPGRVPLTAAEWSAFTASVITPTFPDGFTVTDGTGQWYDPEKKVTDHDPTKVLTVAVSDTPDLPSKIAHVTTAYDAAYDQESVGVTTADGCGKF